MSMSLSLDDGAPERRKVRYICLSVCLLQMTLVCLLDLILELGLERNRRNNGIKPCHAIGIVDGRLT
jgi:hypothetical protein